MTMRLPYALQKRGSVLLNQQCWMWGQDVRRVEGNLLLELGFERVRPPEGHAGCTQYTRRTADAELRLWGFGCYFYDGQGIYLNRFAFAPHQVLLHDPIWVASDMPECHAPTECANMAAALRTLAALESEAQQAAGLAYRTRCLFGWTKRALPPAEVVPAWLALAHDVETHLARHRRRAVSRHNSPRCMRRPLHAA